MKRDRFALMERTPGHREAALWLIVVEGERDEPDWFGELETTGLIDPRRVRLKVVPGTDSAPAHLLSTAEAMVEAYQRQTFDRVWLVFDVDRWPKAAQAVGAGAQSRGWKVALSNPCFQVWLLFYVVDSPPDASCSQLKARWGSAKEEASPGRPLRLTAEAVRRAVERAHAWEEAHPSAGLVPARPGTHVHRLVGELIESAAPFP